MMTDVGRKRIKESKGAMKRKLQVFVSSTYSDLIVERQAAVAAILKAGHIPAGMELFTAGDKSQMKTIERWIDESDVYMLILGGRYGSIEQNTGVSYTELEYDYARAQGKPTFAVVITDDALEVKVKAFGTDYIEKSNPKELKQFRKKVLANISSFFTDEKDVKLCVYESLGDLAANPLLKGWVSGDEVGDIKLVTDELAKLRDENTVLKEKLDLAETSSVKIRSASIDTELADVLRGIEIKVPSIGDNKGFVSNLFSISYANRDTLINGVTNAVGTGEVDQFFYFNIFPKLQAHGLADNEKVPSVRYRRSFLNKAGRAFFAEMERQKILAQKNDKGSEAAAINSASPIELNKSADSRPQKRKKSSKSSDT